MKVVRETDEYRWGLIKKIILDLFVSKNYDPPLPLIHKEAGELINFKESLEVLRRIILILGFKWYESKNSGRKIMLETFKPRLVRSIYLQAMKKYRETQRPIIYLDEMFMPFPNFMAKNEGLNVVQTAGINGFISNGLLTCKSVLKKEIKFFRALTYGEYVKWLEEKMIPNLPPKSIVVIHKCPYFKKQVDKAPSLNATRTEMRLWLMRRGIPYSNDFYKFDLYELICKNKLPSAKKYVLNLIFAKYGHTVLHLPRFVPDWNPMAIIWKDLNIKLKSQMNLTSLDALETSIKQFFDDISLDRWVFQTDLAKLYEKKYYDREQKLDDIEDALLEATRDGNDNSDTNSELESDDFDCKYD